MENGKESTIGVLSERLRCCSGWGQAAQQIGAHFVCDEGGFRGVALALMEFGGAPMKCRFQALEFGGHRSARDGAAVGVDRDVQAFAEQAVDRMFWQRIGGSRLYVGERAYFKRETRSLCALLQLGGFGDAHSVADALSAKQIERFANAVGSGSFS